MTFSLRCALLTSSLLVACGSSREPTDRADAGSDAAVADAGSDAAESRDAAPDADSGAQRPQLAVSGAQLLVTGPAMGLQLTAANVAEDADVVSVHQEFYGVPWASFENGSSPPAEWAALMSSLAAAARQNDQPVFLSINMLNGNRERLAATTRIEEGAVKSDDNSSAPCYDFATAPDRAAKRAAYLRYVEYMLDTFQPAYLNMAIEVNLFFEKCPRATPGLIQVMNAAYDAAKARRPSTVVFPSFQIDHLYGYSADSCPPPLEREACFDALYATLAGIKRDRFAVSSYPYLDGIGGVAQLPADWFSRGAARGGERPLIAETGWPSTALVARTRDGACLDVFSFTEADSAAYLERVLADARRLNMDLVTWWSDRDLLPAAMMTSCPCTVSATWCTVLDIFRGPPPTSSVDTQFFGEVSLKAFGTMGLRSYDGAFKPRHRELWNAARSP